MPKFTSPSGETEFFKQTELQKAFEKELKTGEKVIITPGVKEASFLREAPIRANLAGVYAEFLDRVVNPLPVTQTPIDSAFQACNDSPLPIGFKRFIQVGGGTCTAMKATGAVGTLRTKVFVKPYGQVYPRQPYFYDDPNELNPQWYGFTQGVWPDGTGRNATWPIWDGLYDIYTDTSANEGIGGFREQQGIRGTGIYVNTQQFNNGLQNVPENYPQMQAGLGGSDYIYTKVGKTPSIEAYTIPNGVTIELYVENWNGVSGNPTYLVDNYISIGDVTGATYPYPPYSPIFNYYYSTPDDETEIPDTPLGAGERLIKRLTFDVSMARFDVTAPNVYPYSNCICQFSNFKYTNYFPNP
ncbi:hypothetical protein EBR66_08570, partial [bacterium]|nr:hypothetical protein [bacterium]